MIIILVKWYEVTFNSYVRLDVFKSCIPWSIYSDVEWEYEVFFDLSIFLWLWIKFGWY